jgi:xanthine dehydrogenase accessory factor
MKSNNKSRSLYQEVANLERNRMICAFCIIVESRGSTPRKQGSKMIVYPDGNFTGTIGGGELEQRVLTEAIEAIRTGKPRILHYTMIDPKRGDPGVCGGELEVYIEPIVPENTVLIIGGGHVGKAVAHLASWLGNHVIVSDDRPELCNSEVHPDVEEFLPVPITKITDYIKIDNNFFIVLTTRSIDIDVEGLPGLLNTNAAYIGVIGSRRRWEQTKNALIENGISEDRILKIRSPMGVDIKAETPEEIAISIMAEIISIQKAKDGN